MRSKTGDLLQLYVINLARSPGRRETMRRRLAEIDVAHEFFDAIDAAKDEHLKVSRYSSRRALWLRRRYLSPAEIACFASHYLLWQRCAAGTEPIIIMEDDVSIDAEFAEAVSLVWESIGACGFIRLAGLNTVRGVTVRSLGATHRLVRFLKGPAGTQCYAIAPEGARRLLAGANRWIEPVDDYLDRFWAHGVHSMAILPFHVHHDEGEASLIGNGRHNRPRSMVGALGRTASKLHGSIARRISNFRHLGFVALRG
jgi:glycosyl transferase family 25